MDLREAITNVLERVRQAADPRDATAHAVRRAGLETCHVLAVGKASLAMARGAMDELRGFVSLAATLPAETFDARAWRELDHNAAVFPCDHPLPTARCVDAARGIETWVRALPREAKLLVLISGGASAHLCSPNPGLSVQQIADVTRLLQRAGANIQELNCVRRRLETLKGGGLAAIFRGERIVTFAVSDVVTDTPHDIASGPTVTDPTSCSDAIAVLDRYGIDDASLRTCMRRDDIALRSRGDTFTIVLSNRVCVDAACEAAHASCFAVTARRDAFAGSAIEGAQWLHANARASAGPCAIVLGGEPTVDARGSSGIGGPSQELALAFAHRARDLGRPWALLTYSTDGIDGPTNAAGVLTTSETVGALSREGMADALAGHDSYTYWRNCGSGLPGKATGTNVNHVAAVIVRTPA